MGVSKEAQNARGRDLFKMTADGQRRKKERVVGVSKVSITVVTPLQPQWSHKFWYLISSVCQPSC